MSGGINRLKAGDLNTQIEILRPTQAEDGRGGYGTTWAVIATPWAEVLGQDGREAVIGKALEGISSYRIRIRWRADLTGPAAVELQARLGGAGGTDLNIQSSTDPLGTREQLMIIASTESARSTAEA